MYVERAGCWLSGVETSPGTWSLKLPREAIWSTPVSLSHARVSLGVALGAGWAMLGAALGVHLPRHGVSDKVSPQVNGGHPDLAPRGGRALAVRGGKGGTVVSGDVEQGVLDEVSDALPPGGCLDRGGRLDTVGGARGVEA